MNTVKKTMRSGAGQAAILAVSAAAMLVMSGCTSALTTANSGPVTLAGPNLHGAVHGGRQPIAGASIQLYAASTGGYSGATTNLLPAGTVTLSDGTFDITSLYNCTAGQQMYIVSVGGDPNHSGTQNPQAVLMAGLGDCTTLKATTFISMNEVTTVATAFAMAPFMSGYQNLGSTSTNTAGLSRAMVSVNKLANVNTGYAGGPALAATATAPIAEIYTVADILASCVNSQGGAAGDNSTCGRLFTAATPTSQTAPTDTVGLALMMAHFPTQNVSMVVAYATPVSPYQPTLSSVQDWTMSVKYAPTTLSTPSSTTIDGGGQVWVANAGNNTLTVLAQSGNVSQTLSGNGLATPVTVAIDAGGNGWAANSSDTTVSAFTQAGAAFGASPFTVGSAPSAVAFDGAGNVYVANTGSSSISELNASGTLQNTLTSGVAGPVAIALNPR